MEKIMLWSGLAPHTEDCGGQEQPGIYPFPVAGSRGAVVVCPGGAYSLKAAHEGDPICEMLNEAGISAYRLDYRVAPCRHDTPLTDAKRAIRLVRSMGYEKVGILGFSAGGNLCCCAAVLYDGGDPDSDDPVERLSSRPDAFVPCYAVVSLLHFSHLGSTRNLLGEDCEDLSLRSRYSAEVHVTGDTPPAFIWHTADDTCVDVRNSLMLASALRECGVEYEMHIYPHGPHGMGLATDDPVVSAWSRDCQSFLIRHGFA